MASYMKAVTSVAQQLNETGHHTNNKEHAVIILCGLPDSSDPLIMSIDVNYKHKFSSEDVMTMLLQDECQHTKAASEGASSSGDSAHLQ
jgi:ABC-type uncharacterized transport system YnjBCD substrate-binding protein